MVRPTGLTARTQEQAREECRLRDEQACASHARPCAEANNTTIGTGRPVL